MPKKKVVTSTAKMGVEIVAKIKPQQLPSDKPVTVAMLEDKVREILDYLS
jgi:hypothetical protein